MEILEGQFSADDSARLCRNYRYAAERMTRIMAGWIALTPELSAKLLLEGTRGTVTLNARWEQGESGWRVGALDLVTVGQFQPA